ncbi:MAG TPA: sigma-70 family RNA polymerase sigma factor [Gemmataceae bacterium]
MTPQPLAAAVRHLRKAVAERDSDEQSDRLLLGAFAARRDASAFAAIVRRYGPMVLGVCRRVTGDAHDAEDAFQATFFVLARGAGSVRKADSLAGWLHGVAYRTAMRAKRDAARRRARERHSPQPAASNPAVELTWREVQQALDEEIDRLPESLRCAFVLCCLEGLSKPEAARRLGLKEGTVSGRLAAARRRLRAALGRRGIVLSAVLAAVAVGGPAVRAGLADSAVRGGLAFAAGRAAAAGVPGQALSLAHGATKAMLATKRLP